MNNSVVKYIFVKPRFSFERMMFMAIFKPFRAVRPLPAYACEVAALPYDVMNSAEAAEMVKGNPHSFLHVDKAEIDLPDGTDLYSEQVYLKAKENLEKLSSDGICMQDAEAERRRVLSAAFRLTII